MGSTASEASLSGAPAMERFQEWFQGAVQAELPEPNAFTLATSSADGRVSTRTVLLKALDGQGIVFYTNYGSRKAQQLDAVPFAAARFDWRDQERQIVLRGACTKVSTQESLRYFLSRPRGSQLGAWVSAQSSIISKRSILEGKLDELKAKFQGGEIPLPSFWGGYRIAPEDVRFSEATGAQI